MTQHPIGWQRTGGMALLAVLALSAYGSRAESGSPGAAPDSARVIVEASGIKGGLVVVIGCDDPALLADLRGAGPYRVHGLDDDPEKVAAARKHLRQENLYGPVTASLLRDAQLPYVDSLVNMIVVTGDMGQISKDEMTRVLAPLGVIADARKEKIEITRKDWPEELDEWTHYLYDASNNAVSKDTAVGPPQGMRWTCGPRYARSHEHFASMSAMVTAGGRIFYIIDEGPICSVYLPPQWKLVARDAFSGVLLWKKPITNWEAHLRGFRSGPPEIGRRMVAAGDRLYVSLGYGEPVTVLDAATGKQIATLAGTSGARELVLTGGVLYVLADDMTAAQHDKRKQWMNQAILRSSSMQVIWSRYPRGAFPMYGAQRIAAIKTGSGKLLWERKFKDPGEIAPTTMAVDGGKLCFQSVSDVVCLDAAEGKELWRSKRPIATSRFSWSTPTLVIHDGVVLTVDRTASDNEGQSPPTRGSQWVFASGGSEKGQQGEMVAFSLDDGKELWRVPCEENYNVPLDIFVIGGVVWVGDLRHGDDPGFTQGRDLKSGKVIATLPPQKAYGHHRCYRNKATVRWLMVGRGGIQFVDHKSGKYQNSSVARGSCQYGVMPANGLVYVPHHSCACNPKSLLVGLNALSPRSSAGKGPLPLEKGPAYGEISKLESSSSATGWPTYRRDVRRSGYQDLPAPVKPEITWTRTLSPPITAPVEAGGMVFVAERDRHALHALSATDGKPAWTFIADGRIDSPPTLSGGLCLFGTRAGFVYCLRASDGALAWRFRAAPRDRRLFAYEQLESVWPVHGSVLVDDKLSGAPTVYFAAGRSSLIDGGIRLYALELKTGKVLHERDVTLTRRAGAGRIRQRVLPDILSAQKDAVWMRGLGVDKNLAPVKARPHLFAPRGFLDDTWWHRTYWIYGTEIGGGYTHWPEVGNRSPAGRLLVFDGGKLIYGYGRMAYRAGDGHVRPDMAKGYKLFAEVMPSTPATPKPQDRKRQIKWTAQLPFVARSIVLSRDALLVAGGKSPTETAESHGPGTFWVASREDGSKRAAYKLPAPPILDGMALTDAGVFVSTIDGSVVCLRTKDDE